MAENEFIRWLKELGNDDEQKGAEIAFGRRVLWMKNSISDPDHPVEDAIKRMWGSDNPMHRTIAQQMFEAGALRKEGLERSNMMFADEIAKSAKQLPDISQPLPPIYADDLNRVADLSKQGLTVDVIAQRLALSKSTVKRYRKELGLQRRRKRKR